MDYYESRDSVEPYDYKRPDLTNESEIQQFYKGKTIFITGGAGFLGSLVVEKLLRCCPDVKKIYLLLRPKKGKTSSERLTKLLTNEIFIHLRKSGKKWRSKIECIDGDCELPQCGMKHEDIEKIKNEVNIVFHVAACLNMDAHIRKSYEMNIRATVDLLEIALEIKNLQMPEDEVMPARNM